MCGIVGFINRGKEADRSILERMNAAIIHRGPDEDGFYLKENAALAMRRLAIIDLAGGQQPIFNADRTKAIVFNGEIYNYQELREALEKEGDRFYTNSDTEAIIHLYDKHGPDCLKFLRGMFAFAIWDEREKSLFIARDRVGKKPLLYSHRPDGSLVFGSEFMALLQHPDISREIDREAIDSYLSYLCIPAPLTAYKEIRKLKPGHWLLWRDGEIKTERYWLPDFSKKIKISAEEAEEETLRLLRESVKLRMISEVPVGAFLSGGVDSSTVVALMAEFSEKPVKTFSIGFEEQDFSELKYAKIVANHVGAEYNEFIVRPNALEILPTLIDHYGEPYSDPSALATYYVSRETRNFVTVALNGDGGDESFAGYERHFAMILSEKYHLIPKIARDRLITPLVGMIPSSTDFRNRLTRIKRFIQAASLPRAKRYARWMSNFGENDKEMLYSRAFSESVKNSDPVEFIDQAINHNSGYSILDATLLADITHYLPNDLLVKVDIASMAVSLEARSPFLDHKVMEFAASLPDGIKLKGMNTKYLLKRIASKLVPRDVIYRQKMGFAVPIGHWFRGDLKNFIGSHLLSKQFQNRDLFSSSYIEKLLNEHIANKQDNSWKLWTLLMLELWFQRFID